MRRILARQLTLPEPTPEPTRDRSAELAALIPQGNRILRVFELMEVADQLLDWYVERFSAKQPELRRCFGCLYPDASIRSFTLDCYRDHCRELLERATTARDLRPGTRVEVVAVLYAGSLQAPLQRSYASVYETLMREVFGDARMDHLLERHDAYEAWPGEHREIVEELRRKTARAWRIPGAPAGGA